MKELLGAILTILRQNDGNKPRHDRNVIIYVSLSLDIYLEKESINTRKQKHPYT